MNNPRLLTGLLFLALCEGGVCAASSEPRVYTLDELFESAEAHSTLLRPYFTAEAEARHEADVARTHRLPDINISLSVSYIGDGFTTKRNLSGYSRAPIPHFGSGLGVTVTQPVYTGGAVGNSIELAEMKTIAAGQAADMKRDEIRFHLTGLYLDAYKYSNLRKVVESNIAQARKVLADMVSRFEHGTALRNDITRYELLVSDLELQLIRINNTIDILNHNLIVSAGLPEGTVVCPDTTILYRALERGDACVWQADAERNSPSLRLARTGVEMSRKAEQIVKSDRLPKIGLQAGWTIDGPILVEVPPINRNLSYWYAGVNVSYNLSSIFKTDKSVARSRVAARRMQEELDALNEEVAMAVRTDYIRYLEAYEELKTRRLSVELAERNYATTFTRYTSDMALITDMLDAANAKLDAERQLVDARINIIYYYYKLLFTSGTI